MEMAYLDYAASNPMDRRVADAVAAELNRTGNPSSIHAFGRRAREATDEARARVARLLGVGQSEIVFTSGATEANSLAVFGLLRHLRESCGPDAGLHVLASEIEHSSVLRAVESVAETFGVRLETLPAGRDGIVDPESVRRAIRPDTVLVSVMWANNVTGAVQPITELAGLVADERRRRGADGLPIFMMSDAVQAVRTEEVRPAEAGVDLLTLSGHKMYGPKGVGALYVRKGVGLSPLTVGGGQESGLRGGTENVPGIVGLGLAAEYLLAEREADRTHAEGLMARLLDGLDSVPGIAVTGEPERIVPGIAYLTCREAGDVLVLKLDAVGVAVSSGSACDAGKRRSAGATKRLGGNGLRVSFGRGTDAADIDAFLEALASAVR